MRYWRRNRGPRQCHLGKIGEVYSEPTDYFPESASEVSNMREEWMKPGVSRATESG
jgi:hypothetical protein